MDDETVHPPVGGRDVDVFFDHCSLMSALLTIGAHRAFSSVIRSVRRSGGPPSVRAPSMANCFFASSVLRKASRIRFSLATISGGTPAGAARAVKVPDDTLATPLSPPGG